jgi:hypothetical protein
MPGGEKITSDYTERKTESKTPEKWNLSDGWRNAEK